MNLQKFILVVLLSALTMSCRSNHTDHSSLTANQDSIQLITKDWMTWYLYYSSNTRLAQDFTGLDIDSGNLTKKIFLEKLSTGNFVAMKTGMKSNVLVYRLFTLSKGDSDIQTSIKQLALDELDNESMEGKQIPDFSFTDINGNHYSKADTYNKILILKCWFIGCSACVKEFPKLNKLVDEYQQNKNVLFVSLAMNPKENLVSFLRRNPFRYAVVADQTDYVGGKLDINEFPTHLLVHHGKILKVTNDINDMIPAIRKETEKASK